MHIPRSGRKNDASASSPNLTLKVFTARRVCIARTMPWQDICLSVRLSVCMSHTGIESKRLYISSKFFHHRVAPPFWFPRTKRDGNIASETPLMGASNATGYEKITIFDQYLALSCKWCKIEPYLLWKANRKPHPSFRMVYQFEWSSVTFSRSRLFNVK